MVHKFLSTNLCTVMFFSFWGLFHYTHLLLFLWNLKIRLQGFDVGLEGLVTFGGDAADGAWTLAFKDLFDFDVARL